MAIAVRPPDLKRFFTTYKQAFKIAYTVNSRLLILVIGLNSLWGLTNLPVLYINKILIDAVVGSIGKPDWWPALKLIVWVLIIRTAIEIIRNFLSRLNMALNDTLSFRTDAYVELMLGKKLNALDVPTVESPGFQDKYKRLELESSQRLWNTINQISDIPNAVFTLISGLIPIFLFNPYIGLVVVATRFPEIVANVRIARLDYDMSQKLSPLRRLWGWLSYHLTNTAHLYENKVLMLSDFLSEKISSVQADVISYRQKRRMVRVKYRTATDLPNSFLQLVLNIYFFFLAIIGKITLGTAQMLFQSSLTLGQGFSQLASDTVSLYENYLYIEDLSQFLEQKTKYPSGRLHFPYHIKQGIEFKNVWFKYPTSPGWILKDLNLKISPGENIALVGENGAGKTTLIKLLLGFYRPQKGTIYLDNKDIKMYSQDEYWQNFSALFQEFSQYPFSAGESIAIGDINQISNTVRIKEAAKRTGIHDFISRLPRKYANPLAKELESGIDPSKGQWQRIALARTLFRRAQIIILDEPTSNVDPQAEEEIFDSIIELTKKQILILISHRFSTVRRADRIFVLDRGTIIEQGTHELLLSRKGFYAHLFRVQAKNYR
jgi:ATP-binding cassette subfamily B protein